MIMPFEGTHTTAEQPAHADVSPWQAAADEESYVSTILPIMAPASNADTREEEQENEEQERSGWYRLDRGFW